MLIIKITACEKSTEKPGQMGQQKNHCVCVCVCVCVCEREREERGEREERESQGMRFMEHMMVLAVMELQKVSYFQIFICIIDLNLTISPF